MKLRTPESNELMEVLNVECQEGRLVVRGTIMGTMPIRAVLHPQDLRAGFKLLSWKLIFGLLSLIFRKSSGAAP